MNCRPGDLAFIVRVHPSTGLNDRVVKLADEPPFMLLGAPHWRLETPVFFRIQHHARDATGNHFAPGDVVEVEQIADCNLRPIRGGDLSEDEVRELYAPSTLEVPNV